MTSSIFCRTRVSVLHNFRNGSNPKYLSCLWEFVPAFEVCGGLGKTNLRTHGPCFAGSFLQFQSILQMRQQTAGDDSFHSLENKPAYKIFTIKIYLLTFPFIIVRIELSVCRNKEIFLHFSCAIHQKERRLRCSKRHHHLGKSDMFQSRATWKQPWPVQPVPRL